jgi:glutamyl-Q tRNA(Asp) synthetase
VPPGTIGFEDGIRGRFEQSVADEVGDFVLKRADGFWAYQLAVVVDDALQEITDVVRGADLIDSTPRQILLQQMLGYPTPAYAHLPVIRQADGAKLGKSLHSAPLDPVDPLPALRLAYQSLGQDTGATGGSAGARQFLDRALAAFRPDRIPAKDRILPLE